MCCVILSPAGVRGSSQCLWLNLRRSDESFLLFQEFFHYSVGTILIFIASIVAAVKSIGVSALVAGSVRNHTESDLHQQRFQSEVERRQKLLTEVKVTTTVTVNTKDEIEIRRKATKTKYSDPLLQ